MENEQAPPWKFWLKIFLIAAGGLLVFYPAFDGGWLWDDALYVTGNPLLHEPGRLWKAWFMPGSFIEYYPLEQTVQWLQWRLWGPDTLPYHLTNVFLHIVGALLLWRLLARFGLRQAWLGGLLFVVHPMNVESVAYLSELKNTLSLPPFLLALTAWIDFEATGRRRDYFLALGFFCLAMLCKITMAPFPAVILLYAWWKRAWVGADDVRRALPFLAVSLLLAAITVRAGVQFAAPDPSRIGAPELGGLLPRLSLMGETLAFYFARFFWPLDPLPMYPQWRIWPPPPLSGLSWLAALGAIYFFWRKRATWGRHALLGLGFFLLNLLPFSGLIPTPYMNFTWVMDHFLYLPMIGLVGLVVAAWDQLWARLPRPVRPVGTALIGLLMLFLAVQSQNAAAAWTDGETLWRYTLAGNPGAWLAHYNLANNLRLRRQTAAIDEYRETIRLNPRFAWAHDNLGLALAALPDRRAEAIREYREAIRLQPSLAQAHNNLANALSSSPDDWPAALVEYRTALQLEPDFPAAHYNLGILLSKIPGDREQSRAEFQEALRLDPSFEPARAMLANPVPAGK